MFYPLPSKSLILAISTIPLAGCGWFVGEIDDQEVAALDASLQVTQHETVFGPSLRQLGKILAAYNVPKLPVQSKNIGNASAEKGAPTDLYAMIATALTKVGNPVVFIPYDVQFIMDEASTGGSFQRTFPTVVVSGAITGYDKDMFEKERELEIEGGWAGAQGGAHVDAEGKTSRLSLDLNLIDYKTQSACPEILAANSLLLSSDKLGWGVRAYYMGNGGSFDYSLKRKQGVHAAFRTLVEYSIIEIIGKYTKVPYWKSIPGANPDPNFIQFVRDDFSAAPREERARRLKNLLLLSGFIGLDLDSYAISQSEAKIIDDAMNKYRAADNTALYMELWLNLDLNAATPRANAERKRSLAKAKLDAAHLNQELQAQKQAQQQAFNDSVDSFKKHCSNGDQLAANGKLADALVAYQAAHQLFDGETYPIQKINEINAILAQQQQNKLKIAELTARAEQLYASATSGEFNRNTSQSALNTLAELDKIRPADPIITQRIDTLQKQLRKYTPAVQQKNEEW